MTYVKNTINEMIETPNKNISEQEAIKILQFCGILNQKKQVKPVYKEIVIKVNDKKND